MFKLSAMFAVTALLVTGAVQADTIRVPDDFTGIRNAVAAAASGDTVLVAAGTYSGAENRNIDFEGKTIALISELGPAGTTIDCEELGYGIRIGPGSGSGTLVKGFRIYRGNGGNGAGIIINQSTASIVDCWVINCSASYNGGGIYVGYTTGPVYIEDCEIGLNRARFRGAGLMADRAELYISGTLFKNNDLIGGLDILGGGAIYDAFSDLVSIDKCTFRDNYSFIMPGAILYFSGNMVVTNSIFENPDDFYGSPAFAGSEFEYDRFSCCNIRRISPVSDIEIFSSVNGNFSDNPLYCGYFDYDLWEHSPCLVGPCGQVGAFGQGCSDDPGVSVILSVADVGNDQGRQVRLNWVASENAPVPIRQYAVFRRIEGNKSDPLGDWDFVEAVPEVGLSEYNLVVPTLCDSTINEGMCRTTFFIRSTTDDPAVSYDSPWKSGYSVDNLVPSIPENLLLAGSLLAWDDPVDPDFRFFSVYGGLTEVPDGSQVLVGQTTGTSIDVSGDIHPFYYVSATDFSGNESDFASTPNNVSGTEIAEVSRIALLGNWPNPFNPSTNIAFEIPSRQDVTLQVFDLSGRLVRNLIGGESRASGRHEVVWNGRDDVGRRVASGTYFYRLEAGEFGETRRMVLLK